MNAAYCKLLCPGGSERGTCECRTPRDCRKPEPRVQLQPAPRDRRRPWTVAEHAAVTVVVLMLAVALSQVL